MPVKIKDRGARRVLGLLNSGKRDQIDVGILGTKAAASHKDENGEDTPLTVAAVALFHEYGYGVPKRSWLRGWIDRNRKLVNRRIRKELRATVEGKRSRKAALRRIGVWLQGELQLNIANFPDNGLKPLAESTIKAKGSEVPLIDTGQLRSSITHRINGKETK